MRSGSNALHAYIALLVSLNQSILSESDCDLHFFMLHSLTGRLTAEELCVEIKRSQNNGSPNEVCIYVY